MSTAKLIWDEDLELHKTISPAGSSNKQQCTCCGKREHLTTYIHKGTIFGPPVEQWCRECTLIYNMLGWLKL